MVALESPYYLLVTRGFLAYSESTLESFSKDKVPIKDGEKGIYGIKPTILQTHTQNEVGLIVLMSPPVKH